MWFVCRWVALYDRTPSVQRFFCKGRSAAITTTRSNIDKNRKLLEKRCQICAQAKKLGWSTSSRLGCYGIEKHLAQKSQCLIDTAIADRRTNKMP